MRLDELDIRVVERAQEGDKACRDAVVLASMRLIQSSATIWAKGNQEVEMDDLLSQGVLGVYDALRTFNPARGAFSTILYMWANHHMRRWIQKNNRATNGKTHSSFDERSDDLCSDLTETGESRNIKHEFATTQPDQETIPDAKALLAIAESNLTDVEQDALMSMVAEDETCEEFAVRYGHSVQWARRMRRISIAKMKEFVAD